MANEITASGRLVLCTALLKEKDQKVVKSLGMLLSTRLKHQWLITTKPNECDLCFVYENHLVESTQECTSKVIELSNMKASSENILRYPIKSNEFLSLLNNYGHHADTCPTHLNKAGITQPSDDNNIRATEQTRKAKALQFFKSFLGGKGNKSLPIQRVSSEEIQTQQAKLKSIKERFKTDNRTVNLVFLGTPGSGKTTSIKTISDRATINTEVVAKDSLHFIKSETTVALDYGELELGDAKLRLFGNPGQNRFNYMWDITCKNANVFLILVDSTSPDLIDDLEKYWYVIKQYHNNQPVMVGITHSDLFDDYTLPIDEIKAVITTDVEVVVNCIDPRSKMSMVAFISQVLC